MGEKITGAQSLVYALEAAGATDVFGIPGGAILPLYDPLMDSPKIRHILVRHEQGAGHAAEGYAAASGRVGVVHGDQRSRRHQPGDPARGREHGLRPRRRDHRPGAERRHRHRCLPGGRHPRHHDADHEAQLPHHQPRRHPACRGRGVPPRQHRPARARPRRRVQGRAAGRDRVPLARPDGPARLPPGHQAALEAGARGRAHDHGRQAARALRRRRRHPRPRVGRAAPARRPHRHPGRHDADGPRRLPRLPPAAHGHARHARHGGRRGCAAEVRPAHHPGRAVRRPRHRQAVDRSPRTPGSSTPTSTRPRSARTARPTSRSSATSPRSSPS